MEELPLSSGSNFSYNLRITGDTISFEQGREATKATVVLSYKLCEYKSGGSALLNRVEKLQKLQWTCHTNYASTRVVVQLCK
jgi:hypothetical protein